jgi:serine protease Do
MHEDDSSQPPQTPYLQPAARYSPPPAACQPQVRLAWAIWMLLLLLAFLVLPTFIERIEYALARGKMQAQAEVAREQLERLADLADKKGLADNPWKNGLPVTIGAYRYVAMAIEPSVVGVKATQIVGGQPTDEISSLFDLGQRRPRFREQDQGSGVIVDPAGYILTNYHVVGRATDVSVELSDRSQHKAQIIGVDPATDLAVLKISASGLIAAPFGNSDALEVGDPVLAVGNPFGLARTVTSGIVSAKGRRAVIENVNYQDFLQTDAAVNPGNSGGPLVNMIGEVVGINTAIVGPTYQGISFAIPSSLAKGVYEKLKSTGKVARGWLGVATQELTPDLAEKLGVESTHGAVVNGVVGGSPAAEAGIKLGDVIVAWNDKPIDDPGELGLAVASTPIGSKATVKVIRNGKEQSFTMTVGERPERLR